MEIKIKNEGTNDQDDVVLFIENKELGLYIETEEFKISEFGKKRDSVTDSFNLNIADDVKPGEYSILTKLVYDNEDASERAYANLVISECKEKQNINNNRPNNQKEGVISLGGGSNNVGTNGVLLNNNDNDFGGNKEGVILLGEEENDRIDIGKPNEDKNKGGFFNFIKSFFLGLGFSWGDVNYCFFLCVYFKW